MKKHFSMNKIKSYLKELTIVTVGVLIALIISNIKENHQAKQYKKASIDAVKNEIESNYATLRKALEDHVSLRDTIEKYSNDNVVLSELIFKSGGLQIFYLENSGLDFYKRNEINLIDFELMSILISLKSSSDLIETKMVKLVDYLYPNLYVDSEESKKLVILYLGNVLNTESQLYQQYENFMKKYGMTIPEQE